MMIDIDPFPEALINMINLNWVEKGKAKATWGEMKEINQVVRPFEVARRLPNRP